MRILLVNQSWGLSGGQEEYILQVGNGLIERGHEVKLLYGKFGGQKVGIERGRFKTDEISGLKSEGVLEAARHFRAEVINLQNVFDPGLVRALSREFPTTRFVHDHSGYCPGNSKYFFNSGKICTIATSSVCLVNAYKEKCMTRRPFLSIQRVRERSSWLGALKGLPVLMCNSNYVKGQLVLNGLNSERIVVNGLFPGHGLSDQSGSSIGSDPLARTDPQRRGAEILFVGRLFKEKGVDLLLKSCALIKSKFHLNIVGEGWEKERLMELSKQLRIEKRVKFLGFKVGPDLVDLYRQSDFLVLPSVWPEPFGMVGLEAHLFKKPVIAFNVGGIPDWLENGVNGFLLEEITPMALAERMEILINSPDLAKKMGGSGLKKVENQFNLQRHLDVLEQVYLDLKGSHSSS